MKANTSFELVIHTPKTEAGLQALRQRVSEVHAEYVITSINHLKAPAKQKLDLLQAVIDTIDGTYDSKQKQSRSIYQRT